MNKRTFLKSLAISSLSVPVLGLNLGENLKKDIYRVRARSTTISISEVYFNLNHPIKIGDIINIGMNDKKYSFEIIECSKKL
jgi:hypothetical protein